jgi:hypothetical protein
VAVVQSQSEACATKNPFIGDLKKHGVAVFETPQVSNSSMCRYEWSMHKTCCDSESLRKYAKDDEDSVNGQIERVAEDYRQFTSFVRSMRRRLFALNLMAAKLSPSDQGSVVVKADQISKELLKNVEAFKIIGSKAQEKFTEENSKCWKKMAKVRQSTLCPVCSGRSEKYFLNNLALLDSDYCSSIVKACSSSFAYLISYLKAVASVGPLLHLENQLGEVLVLSGEKESINVTQAQILVNEFKEEMLPQILGSQDLEKDLSGKNDGVLSRWICRLALKLHGSTLLSKLDQIVHVGELKVNFQPAFKTQANKNKVKAQAEKKEQEVISLVDLDCQKHSLKHDQLLQLESLDTRIRKIAQGTTNTGDHKVASPEKSQDKTSGGRTSNWSKKSDRRRKTGFSQLLEETVKSTNENFDKKLKEIEMYLDYLEIIKQNETNISHSPKPEVIEKKDDIVLNHDSIVKRPRPILKPKPMDTLLTNAQPSNSDSRKKPSKKNPGSQNQKPVSASSNAIAPPENDVPGQEAKEDTPAIDLDSPLANMATNNYFQGDVMVMKPSDSLFDSKVGGKGLTDPSLANSLPMNLTHAFP